jgi:histidinol-phosphate aminotransferase
MRDRTATLINSFKIKNLRRNISSNQRFNKIRLDKNEKTDYHSELFFNKVIKKIKHHHLTAYPELENIYKILSKKLNIDKNSILLTYGSDGGIKTCFDFLTERNDKIIFFEPTFAMVSIYSKVKRLKPVVFKYDNNLKLDFKKIKKKILEDKIKLIIFANPNSPTGNSIENKKILEILDICKKKNTFVIIDEAYFGFYKTSFIKYINKYKNLIILRTFSKSFGLAGLRAGFLATNKKLCREIFKTKPMYEMTTLTSIFVEEIIKNKKLENIYIKNIKLSKKIFINFLKNKNIKFIDTKANFVHVEIIKHRSKFFKALEMKQILINDNKIVKGLDNYVRISIGSKSQMKKVMNILNQL